MLLALLEQIRREELFRVGLLHCRFDNQVVLLLLHAARSQQRDPCSRSHQHCQPKTMMMIWIRPRTPVQANTERGIGLGLGRDRGRADQSNCSCPNPKRVQFDAGRITISLFPGAALADLRGENEKMGTYAYSGIDDPHSRHWLGAG